MTAVEAVSLWSTRQQLKRLEFLSFRWMFSALANTACCVRKSLLGRTRADRPSCPSSLIQPQPPPLRPNLHRRRWTTPVLRAGSAIVLCDTKDPCILRLRPRCTNLDALWRPRLPLFFFVFSFVGGLRLPKFPRYGIAKEVLTCPCQNSIRGRGRPPPAGPGG